ncbi:MAG TPA: hypothetical protein DEF36_04670 [Desulfotomaculum sp.]|nr:hypothetical protein [Desulfotomaculum sp.]
MPASSPAKFILTKYLSEVNPQAHIYIWKSCHRSNPERYYSQNSEFRNALKRHHRGMKIPSGNPYMSI